MKKTAVLVDSGQGRFKCQALLEEQAVLSAMAYVDLNPVRADMCETLEDSDHTSVQCRLKERSESGLSKSDLLGRPLKPVAGIDADAPARHDRNRLSRSGSVDRRAGSSKRNEASSTAQKKADSEQPPEGHLVTGQPPQAVDAPGSGHRKPLLPRHRVCRGIDGQSGRTRSAMDEGRQRANVPG